MADWRMRKGGRSGYLTNEARKNANARNYAGQAVYEPFSWSGTTIIACQRTGRLCCAIELNPAYVDIAVIRWQDYTGEQATLEATGETMEQVKLKRETYGDQK